jgi:cellobiose-specific phosphotransferase system component IIC
MTPVVLILWICGVFGQTSVVNPWKPTRTTTTNPDEPKDKSTYAKYHFAVKDFLIILGCLFLGITLVVGAIILFRALRKKNKDVEQLKFEKEEAALMRRANSLRDPKRGQAGMRGDLGDMRVKPQV